MTHNGPWWALKGTQGPFGPFWGHFGQFWSFETHFGPKDPAPDGSGGPVKGFLAISIYIYIYSRDWFRLKGVGPRGDRWWASTYLRGGAISGRFVPQNGGNGLRQSNV